MIDNSEIPFILKVVPLFKNFPINMLSVLADFVEKEFQEEETFLFNEGDIGSNIFIIQSGEIACMVGYETVEIKGELDWLGQLALLTNQRWEFSAFAISDIHYLRLPQDVVFELVSENNEFARHFFEAIVYNYRASPKQTKLC